MWGTTLLRCRQERECRNFNPHPPCGGRRTKIIRYIARIDISIHVPRVGDDMTFFQCVAFLLLFQSTSPVWGTTGLVDTKEDGKKISIHVPRMGDDRWLFFLHPVSNYFNPRPPHGGRQLRSTANVKVKHDFNPRPPRGGRLMGFLMSFRILIFQSTSPAWGTTYQWGMLFVGVANFNPRPPRGGRHEFRRCCYLGQTFQSTSPAWGTTRGSVHDRLLDKNFNPRPPRGGRQRH